MFELLIAHSTFEQPNTGMSHTMAVHGNRGFQFFFTNTTLLRVECNVSVVIQTMLLQLALEPEVLETNVTHPVSLHRMCLHVNPVRCRLFEFLSTMFTREIRSAVYQRVIVKVRTRPANFPAYITLVFALVAV